MLLCVWSVLLGILGPLDVSSTPEFAAECSSRGPKYRWQVTTVLPLDTWESVAEEHDVDVDELMTWNPQLSDGELSQGVRLRVCSDEPLEERFLARIGVSEDTTWVELAVEYDLPLDALLALNRRRAGGNVAEGAVVYVYVPKTRWTRKTLDGPVQLESGEGIVVKHPQWAWGRPVTVRTLQALGKGFQAAFPGESVIVGDLSKKRGGSFPPHTSHKGGLDADLGLFSTPPREGVRFFNLTADEVDVDRLWFVVRWLLESGRVTKILLDWSLQGPLYERAVQDGLSPQLLEEWFHYPFPRRTPRGLIQHYPGHRHHIHVRFLEPDDEVIL
jgi:hypothetical protein